MAKRFDRSKLSKADVKALCDTADAASRAKPRSRNVTFTWRGHRFKIRLSTFAMYIDLLDGSPVAMRYT